MLTMLSGFSKVIERKRSSMELEDRTKKVRQGL